MRGSLIRPLVERIKNVSVMHILGGFIGVNSKMRDGGRGGGNDTQTHRNLLHLKRLLYLQ